VLLCTDNLELLERQINIFVLDTDPKTAAQAHCNSHVLKMILEYGQLLSSAHRVLDGTVQEFQYAVNDKVKTKKFIVLDGETAALVLETIDGKEKYKIAVQNKLCYSSTHANHPCAVWTRVSNKNYLWLFELFKSCLTEYTIRYGRIHAAAAMVPFLSKVPKNITVGEQTPFAVAMPEQYRVNDAVLSYQNYYVHDKIRFAKWTNRAAPEWFANRLPDGSTLSDFERTTAVVP
jgi:hypothetical protein